MINIDKVAYKEVNFKSKLIEWSQKNKVNLDFSQTTQSKDANGNPTFCCVIKLEGLDGCMGKGFSKKESQQKAAKDTLDKLKREPQFIDSVFAAKASRTKMEEEPVQDVPSTSEAEAFVKTTDASRNMGPKHETSFREQVFSEEDSALERPVNSVEAKEEEFDLSDISAREKTREEIIAAAEEAAFVEDGDNQKQ